MKKLLTITFLVLVSVVAASAQVVNFPGVSAAHRKTLTTAKRSTAIPLPTWVPAGFAIEKIEMKLGPRVKIEDKQLVIIYSRKLANGKMQRFSLEGGFDGLGGLPYDLTKTLTTPVGEIDLMYEPKDYDDESKKVKNFVMTEWFKVGRTDFHYNGMHGANEDADDPGIAMLSLADTEKILKSLRRY
jgi:hypothetical protein